MNKLLLYPHLAFQNIKKNSRAYFPFILTCVFTAAMFFVMLTISCIRWVDSAALSSLLSYGVATVGFFSAVFLYYTNSFLIKQRKKEFGLYSILGMEKRHVSRILLIESIYLYIISTALGIGLGALFSKLVFLLLIKILGFGSQISFRFYGSSFAITAALFAAIAVLNLLHNVISVRLSNPVELLRGSNVGEKEPKAKFLTAFIGLACLATGYGMALSVKNPLSALALFFIAVILVIIGTYLLFSSGSIWILKALKKNKNYYYQTKHFTSVSSMMYRMKQNAAGLASICILSTMVLVTVSTTVSLYAGTENVMRTRFARNIEVESTSSVTDTEKSKINKVIESECSKADVKQKDIISYSSLDFIVSQHENSFEKRNGNGEFSDGSGTILVLIPVADYNNQTGENLTLSDNEVIVGAGRGDSIGSEITFAGRRYSVVKENDKFKSLSIYNGYAMNYYFIFVSDSKAAENIYNSLRDSTNDEDFTMIYHYGFDTNADSETQIALTNSLSKQLSNCRTDGAEASRTDLMSLYGGLFFIGITCGLLFLIGTVLIIYYKQISEGYDDRERFRIMQNVGMSKKEVQSSIKSQVMIMFFLPLVTAVIHICFSFNMITKILAVLNLTDISLFVICTAITVVVFAIIYALVYFATSKTYYNIVENKR